MEAARVRGDRVAAGRRVDGDPGRRIATCLALAAGLLAQPAAAELPGPGSCQGCNVVIISIDTLRPDRLQPWGYPRETSPELASLASRGIRFERAYSTASTTADAHMSLFTSLYPSVHGVHTLGSPDAVPHSLAEGIPTLAALLRSKGYATAGFHHGGNVSPEFGFDRGFDVYRKAPFMTGLGWKATRDWLSETSGNPFFVFLHTYHVHDPYTPERGARELFAGDYEGSIISDRRKLKRLVEQACADDPDCLRWRLPHRIYWSKVDPDVAADVAHLSDLYDAEIQEVDRALPRMIAALERMPGDTLVIILSDHGEAFGEHDKMMHSTLHEEIIRIPLLVLHPRAPEQAGHVVRRPISLLNLSPLIVGWLGFDAPDSFQGEAGPAEEILAEGLGADQVALVRDGMKLLLRGRGGPPADPKASAALRRVADTVGLPDPERFQSIELFDLREDPGEQRNLAPDHPALEPMLRGACERVLANRAHRESLGPVPAARSELSEETRHQLEALGYLD